MEHIISLSNNYHPVQPDDLPIVKTVIGALIDRLTQPFGTAKQQKPMPGSRHCCLPKKPCAKHGVNCPRFSPLPPV